MVNWTLVTIGNLSRNAFWGEDLERPHHPVLATCSLIQAGGMALLVDPSLPAPQMEEALYNRTGLRPRDIHLIYITHGHGDHYQSLELFPQAQKFMAPQDYMDLRGDAALSSVRPAPETLLPGSKLAALPGHTKGLCGLLLDAPEGRVLFAGDAVMTKEYFRARTPYHFGLDADMARASMARAARLADVIVPGHGNYFLTRAYNSF